MASDLRLRGVYVPLITPYDTDGSVAVDVIERLCHEYLDDGAAGIVALGTTGESTALDAEERAAVIDACSRACSERDVPLIVGTGTNNTRTTIERCEALVDVPGAVAALTVVPYYIRPNEFGIVEHFRNAAMTSPVPLILYNIPYRTGRGLGAESLIELARTENIAGVKQAVGSIDTDTLKVLATHPERFHLLGGEDPFLFPLVLMGASGAICASSHVCTPQFVSMIDCGLAGKVDEGRRLAEALLPVVQAGFAEPNPAVFKGVLHAQGRIPTPEVRPPLLNATPPAIDHLLIAIEAVGDA